VTAAPVGGRFSAWGALPVDGLVSVTAAAWTPEVDRLLAGCAVGRARDFRFERLLHLAEQDSSGRARMSGVVDVHIDRFDGTVVRIR
jgi:hypothetical protein